MEKNLKLVVKYKLLTDLMFLCCVIHPINLCGMFTRHTMPARVRSNITSAQRAIIAAAEKAAEEAKAKIRYKEILQEGQRIQFLKSIKVQASDGVTTIPFSIAKRSEILMSILSDLGGISKDPIPLPQYSLSVIRDVCNIIPRRFTDPEKIEQQIAKYSLQHLVERFSFVHYLKFPKNIKDIFGPGIIGRTQIMGSEEIMQNKEIIKLIDPHIPEFKALVKAATIPYLMVTDNQGKLSYYIPKDFYTKSERFFAISCRYKEGEKVVLDYDLVARMGDILKIIGLSKMDAMPTVLERLGYRSLEKLIPIINCLDYFGFSSDIQKGFQKELYSLCKEISFDELVLQLETLSPHELAQIFGNVIIDKLKSCLLEKALTMDDRKTVLDIGYEVAFSPDNKMFATSDDKVLQLWKFNNDGTTSLSQTLTSDDEISTIAFSANSEKLAIAKENKILLYDISDKGIIDKDPQMIAGYQGSIVRMAFSPNGKFMVAANSHKQRNNLLLWTFSKNGDINDESPQIILSNEMHHYIRNAIQFNDDGTLYVISGPSIRFNDNCTYIVPTRMLELSVFNEDCILKLALKIEGGPAHRIVFYRYDKKFIIASEEPGDCYLDMYDFNNENVITKHSIFHHEFRLDLYNIFNDTTIICKPRCRSGWLSFMDIATSKYKEMKNERVTTVQFRPDGKKMIISSICTDWNRVLYTILTDEEEQKLDNLKRLDEYQIILIDKMLHGATDLPSLEDYEVPQSTIDFLNSLKPIS